MESSKIQQLEECLRAILDYRPSEICYDEFAYNRMVESYRDAARSGLKIAEQANGGSE